MTNLPRPVGAVPPPAPPPMPVDVGTSRQLWWGVVGFGVVQLVASVIAALPQRHSFAKQVFEQARAQDPQVTLASAELMVTLVYVVVVFLGLAVAGLALLIVHQFARGKLWARTMLTIVGAWLVVIGVGALFAFNSVTGTASLVAGGAAIVQAVLAGGAIYLSHRPESTAYFQMSRR
ncbi:hypothetical protein [Nocardia iowensis]|uniref:Integral membrane protein n=1 Tax=Nocardia iowensis TaxID=204891 RepID=A0ABX8RQ92_NOCIO|nr:hypothetical protein [Nocardia iowensis]QXN91069.1 hypothetical protein KV110_37975 [Nocardia iowensis]